MPASFRPSSTRSLGHLIRTGAPVTRWMGHGGGDRRHGGQGQQVLRRPLRPPQHREVQAQPLRRFEAPAHAAPARRLPPAITAVPLGAPWAARLLHTVLVESTVS